MHHSNLLVCESLPGISFRKGVWITASYSALSRCFLAWRPAVHQLGFLCPTENAQCLVSGDTGFMEVIWCWETNIAKGMDGLSKQPTCFGLVRNIFPLYSPVIISTSLSRVFISYVGSFFRCDEMFILNISLIYITLPIWDVHGLFLLNIPKLPASKWWC